MNEAPLEAAAEVQAFLAEQGWPFCFIGGLANFRWGQPRSTLDADAMLFVGYEKEEKILAALAKRFQPRRPDFMEFGLESRVALLQIANPQPVGIDVSLAAMPFEDGVIKRSSEFRFNRRWKIRTCGAEDLVIMKAFADRPKDWGDIDGVLRRQRGKLDFNLVRSELRPLLELKEEPEIMDKLEALIRKRAKPPA